MYTIERIYQTCLRIKLISTFLLLVCLFNPASAQTKIFGGVSVPMSDLASVDSATGGFARIGFSLGVEHISKFYFGCELGISGILCFYPINAKALLNSQPHILPGSPIEANPWILFWPTVSLGCSFPISDNFNIYARGHGGLFYGVFPEISVIEAGTMKYTRNLSIKVTSGLGISAGVMMKKKYDFEIRYLFSRPQYELNTPAGGVTNTSQQSVKTMTIQFAIGYVL
jgi:hypothetical protein